MQIPFMIMQHVKHKASALITSTHPPTTVLLPTSLPAEKKGWVGEGVIFDIFDLHHRLFILGAVWTFLLCEEIPNIVIFY